VNDGPVVVVTQRAHADTIAFLARFSRPTVNPSAEPWNRETLVQLARDAEALMVFMPDRVDEALLAACPRLRVVAGALKGFDNVDVEACTRRRIWMTIVPDLLTEPTADLALALLLGLARNVAAGDRLVRSGTFAGWRPHLYGIGMQGRRAGIVGMGAVGRALARRLAVLGTEIAFHDAAEEDGAVPGGRLVGGDWSAEWRRLPLDELLATSDFVLPLLPLTPSTLRMFDAARLRRFKPGALLVNVARGSLVDEEAVAEAIEGGRLSGYAADVFEMEDWAREDRPRAVSARLIALTDRTLFTPHLGTAVTEVRRAIELHAARQIELALRGQRPDSAINAFAG